MPSPARALCLESLERKQPRSHHSLGAGDADDEGEDDRRLFEASCSWSLSDDGDDASKSFVVVRWSGHFLLLIHGPPHVAYDALPDRDSY